MLKENQILHKYKIRRVHFLKPLERSCQVAEVVSMQSKSCYIRKFYVNRKNEIIILLCTVKKFKTLLEQEKSL